MEHFGPEEALSTGAKIMIDHLRHLAGVSEETLAVITQKKSRAADSPVR